MGEGYAYELKYDGTQVRVFKKGSQISLITKRGIDRTTDYLHIATELARIEGDFVLLGEICFFEGDRAVFPINNAQKPKTKLVVFDIVERGDYEARRKHIESIIHDSPILMVAKRYSDFKTAWKDVIDKDLEGVVAKPLKAHFQLELGIKMKNHTDKDVEIAKIEVNENGYRTFEGIDGTRAVCYDHEEIREIEKARSDGKRVVMTIENLTGTRRNPKYKKYEVK